MDKEDLIKLREIIDSLQFICSKLKGQDYYKFNTHINGLKLFVYSQLNPELDFPDEKNNN